METGRYVSACHTSYGVKTDEDMTSFDELYDMYHAHICRFAIVRSETPVKRRAEGAGGSAGPEKCPSCGKTVEGGWKACPACGASLDPGDIRQA